MNGEANVNMNSSPDAGRMDYGAPGDEQPRPAGYCRMCGRGLTESEIHRSGGVVYCVQHAPAPAAAEPAPPSDWEATAAPKYVDTSVSPGLAFVLGLIPGVGAIYNAQYAKGFIHVVIFGLLISVLNSDTGGLEPLFAMLMSLWIFYMAFEAYHTAKKRQAGLPVDEFSSLVPLTGRSNSLMGPITLIILGGIFLLFSLNIVEMYQVGRLVGRFWPLVLILLGVWMLVARRGARSGQTD
jgi:hypothetical protein